MVSLYHTYCSCSWSMPIYLGQSVTKIHLIITVLSHFITSLSDSELITLIMNFPFAFQFHQIKIWKSHFVTFSVSWLMICKFSKFWININNLVCNKYLKISKKLCSFENAFTILKVKKHYDYFIKEKQQIWFDGLKPNTKVRANHL